MRVGGNKLVARNITDPNEGRNRILNHHPVNEYSQLFI
jgi:hypothetical protein